MSSGFPVRERAARAFDIVSDQFSIARAQASA